MNAHSKLPLLSVLREAREFLARPDNEFVWSSWDNGTEAVGEIDCLIACIESGDMPKRLDLEVLFAATGSIQEVSLSSGWGGEFLRLSQRFDAALRKI
jgi:hypothetical protein